MTTSLLPDVDIVDAINKHNDGLAKDATKRYTIVVGRAHSGLVKLANKAAHLHDDPVDATNAAADLLERFSESVEGNGDAIVSSLAQQTAGTNQVQARELAAAEQRALAAEHQLAEANSVQEQLRQSALEASNLRGHLDTANTDKARLQRELTASQAEVQRLKQEANKPNPLTEEVRTLKSENSGLKAQLSTLRAEKAALQEQLDKTQAPAAPVPPVTVAAPAPVVEPPAEPGGGTMIGGIKGQPASQPAPKKRVRDKLRDALPGHGQNQAEEV